LKDFFKLFIFSEKIAARSLPEDQFTIRQLVKEITNLTDSICELRHQGRDNQVIFFEI